jgi:hypothetical protein
MLEVSFCPADPHPAHAAGSLPMQLTGCRWLPLADCLFGHPPAACSAVAPILRTISVPNSSALRNTECLPLPPPPHHHPLPVHAIPLPCLRVVPTLPSGVACPGTDNSILTTTWAGSCTTHTVARVCGALQGSSASPHLAPYDRMSVKGSRISHPEGASWILPHGAALEPEQTGNAQKKEEASSLAHTAGVPGRYYTHDKHYSGREGLGPTHTHTHTGKTTRKWVMESRYHCRNGCGRGERRGVERGHTVRCAPAPRLASPPHTPAPTVGPTHIDNHPPSTPSVPWELPACCQAVASTGTREEGRVCGSGRNTPPHFFACLARSAKYLRDPKCTQGPSQRG